MRRLQLMNDAIFRYPAFDVRLKKISGRTFIFDFIRKKWLALSPEEWVRQHLLNYLVTVKKIPVSLISVEKELELNGTKKRYDAVVYDRQLTPWLVAECKAPYIGLDQSVLEQALRYNLVLKAPFLIITNGVNELVFDRDNQLVELPESLSLQA
jgi:hypothetical protein